MIGKACRVARSHFAGRLAVVVLYVGLAFWSTWPLARAPLSTLPLGPSQVATVPLFNLWTIWWNADRLRHGLRDYWNAPIFFPATDAFAFSEPQPATGIVAPIVWLTGSRALAFNVYLWLSLVLNGVFAERLLRTLGTGRPVAIGGGVAMLLLPIVHWQLDVLQLAPLWAILWTWTALVKVTRRPSLMRGIELGGAGGAAFWVSIHQGLLLAVLLAGAAWILPRRWRSAATWLPLLSAAVVAAALVLPLAIPMRQAMATHNFVRTADFVAQLSARAGDYTVVPGKLLVDFGSIAERPYWRLSPGWIKWILASLGIALGLQRRRRRRWTIFLVLTIALGFLLSLGTNLHFGTWEPWWTLAKFIRGLSQVRNVFRFAFFVQMAVVLLAAQAVYGLFVANRRFLKARWARCLAGSAISLLGLAALAETRPLPPNVAAIPDAVANAGWINFVRDNTPRGRGIACVPFASADSVESYEGTARWMYFGTFHGVPLVDGYSGFFPREHFEMRNAVYGTPMTAACLEQLASAGTEFLVVRRAEFLMEFPREEKFGSVWIQRVFEDSIGIDVYRLSRDPPVP